MSWPNLIKVKESPVNHSVSAQEAEARFSKGDLQCPARVLVERDAGWLIIKDAEFGA